MGTYSPQIIEPYTVQTNLANKMADQAPGLLLPLMNYYDQMHQTGEAQYNDQLNTQRNIAYQNIHAQMVDNAVKAMDVSMKNPAAFDLIAHAPGFSSLLGGADADTVNRVGTTLQNQQLLGNYKTIGEAATGMAGGGITPPVADFSRITGTNLQPQLPTSTTNALIAGNARIAAEQARANAAETETIPVQTDQLGPALKGIGPLNVKVRKGASDAEKQAAVQQAIKDALAANPAPGTGLIPDSRGNPTPGTTPGGSPGAAPSPTPKNVYTAPDGTKQTSDTSGASPLMGPFNPQDYQGAGLPVPTNLQPSNGGLLPPAKQDTPANAPPPASGGAQAAPARTTTSAASPSMPQQLPDTPVRGLEMPTNKYNIALQQRAIQGLPTLPQGARDEIMQLRMKNSNIIPIRRIGGVEYYIGGDGRPLGRVP